MEPQKGDQKQSLAIEEEEQVPIRLCGGKFKFYCRYLVEEILRGEGRTGEKNNFHVTSESVPAHVLCYESSGMGQGVLLSKFRNKGR